MMRGRSLIAAVGILVTAGLAGCGGDSGADQTAEQPPAAGQPSPAAPGAGDAAPSTPAAGGEAQLVQSGQQVFTGPGLCTACHGPTGTGTALGPDLTDGEWLWIDDPNDPNLHDQVATLIRTGIAQPREAPAPMPPMGGASLNDDQLNAVTAYVISLAQ